MKAGSGEGRTTALAAGLEMPLLGLGVWQVPDGAETENAVGWALESGYRHVDTAQAYGNEPSVGRALAASGIPREEVFVTTKFRPAAEDPVAEAERSLERLGIERLDLYLIHWPQGGPTWAWRGMEQTLERGLTRAIGVSNFDVDELGAVSAMAEIPPAVNQIQFSPFAYRRRLLAACEQRGVTLEAYSPLTTAKHLGDAEVGAIAAEQGRSPAQVLLRWAVQRGIPVIPKSTHRERIIENSRIFDFSLTEDEMTRLDELDLTGGTATAVEHKWWTLGGRIRNLAARLTKPLRG